MKNYDQLVQRLKKGGFKITRARTKIVEMFCESSTPISALDLIISFQKLKIPVNKTTIYRELEFLVKNGYIKEIEFGEGMKRYELEGESHHHHLICLKCKKVLDVELKIELEKEEARLERENKFKIRNHNLEFFGYCSNCL